MEIISQRLRELREGLHYSQARLSKHMEVSQASINRYENDLSTPAPETLIKYADFFNVSLDYIFGRTDSPRGKKYSYVPDALKEQIHSRDEWEQFVEMCFDPKSPMSARLKETMLSMIGDDT